MPSGMGMGLPGAGENPSVNRFGGAPAPFGGPGGQLGPGMGNFGVPNGISRPPPGMQMNQDPVAGV
jgi:hypothetical protein